MRLSGQVAVITGGTRGLGRVMAEGFLAEGASVVCASRNPHDIEELVARSAGRAAYHRADVTDEASVEALMDRAVREFGGLDVLVCNAGTSADGKIARLGLDGWESTLATNLTGTFLCTRAAVAPMEARGGGRIITVSSSLSSRPAIGAAAYSSSKAAVEMFTRTAAAELAPKNIRVNCLSPGYFDEGMGKRFADTPSIWETHRLWLSLGRLGRGPELVAAAVFLAGPDSSYVNGHVLEVNGGLQ
ncbi:SDR family NAD(P)-dependent oxidoreductase [Actinosynnema sp. NPDC051121]